MSCNMHLAAYTSLHGRSPQTLVLSTCSSCSSPAGRPSTFATMRGTFFPNFTTASYIHFIQADSAGPSRQPRHQVQQNRPSFALCCDDPPIRSVLIEAYSVQRSSGQLKFSGSSSFKTPKEITLEIRALAHPSSKIAPNTCSTCGKGLVVSLPSQGQAGLFDHR